jgi:hypothetical protein
MFSTRNRRPQLSWSCTKSSAIAGLVEGYRKALETTELECRIKALEERPA